MPTFAGENLAGQLPAAPDLPPADPDPRIEDRLPGRRDKEGVSLPGRPMPIPAWRQPYMRTDGLKAPSEWAQPDYILQGARGYPGIAPGPWMPQLQDTPGIMRQVGMYFAGNGSIPNQLIAGQMLAYYDKFEKEKAAGMLARANLTLKQAEVRHVQLTENTENELRQLAEAHAAYVNDPQKLRQAWLNLSYQFNDPVLRDVIQTQGLERAEAVISEKHNNNLDSLKLIHQRLENDKLQQENETAKEKQQLIREIYQQPSSEQKAQEAAEAPLQGVNPKTGIANEPAPSGGLMSTDPSVAPGTAAAPTYSWFPKAATAPSAAPAPPAITPTSNFPVGITAENAGDRRGELTDWANRNGVAVPPPDTSGLRNWVAEHQAAGAGLAIDRPPAARLLAGFDRETLDLHAWRYLETRQLPHTQSGGKDFNEYTFLQNEAVKRRSSELDLWLNRLLNIVPAKAQQLTPSGERDSIDRANQTLAQLATAEPNLAARLRSIIEGRTPMPAGGFGGNSPFGQKVNAIVERLDPTYSTIRYENNRATQRYWNAGQGAQRLSGFKQAILHGRSLLHALEAMPNTRFRDLNGLINAIQTHAGLPYTTEADSIFGHYFQELTRAFRGSAGALGDINRERDVINANASPEQMRTYIRSTVELLDTALVNMADDWNRGTMQNRRGTDMVQNPDIIAALAELKGLPLPSDRANALRSNAPIYNHNTPDAAVDPRDAGMVQWLKANPNDPRANVMRQILQAKGLI